MIFLNNIIASANSVFYDFWTPASMGALKPDRYESKKAEAPVKMRSRTSSHQGFTLVEVLVVIVIILIVSVLALPTIMTGLSHRQVGEAARLLQAVLAGARDAAIRDNSPSGIRLLPDPLFNGINASTGPA